MYIDIDIDRYIYTFSDDRGLFPLQKPSVNIFYIFHYKIIFDLSTFPAKKTIFILKAVVFRKKHPLCV